MHTDLLRMDSTGDAEVQKAIDLEDKPDVGDEVWVRGRWVAIPLTRAEQRRRMSEALARIVQAHDRGEIFLKPSAFISLGSFAKLAPTFDSGPSVNAEDEEAAEEKGGAASQTKHA